MRKTAGIVLCLLFLAACGSTNNTTATHQTLAQATTGNVFQIQLVTGVPGWNYPAVDVTSHDQSVIAQFIAHTSTLKLVTGEYPCPFDNGYALHLTEDNATGNTLFTGTVSISGCRFLTIDVHGASQSYWPDALFWQQLSQLAGQTMPPQGTPANS